MIKRDFLYEHKITLIILIAIQVLFLLLNLIMPAVTLKFYQPVYLMMLVGILFYPVMVFKKISPRVGDYFNAYSMTSHLPFSKKQLMWMGIKPWIVIAPIYLLVTTMMMAYFRAQAINQLFFELLFGENNINLFCYHGCRRVRFATARKSAYLFKISATLDDDSNRLNCS